jgi:hypothetical protein
MHIQTFCIPEPDADTVAHAAGASRFWMQVLIRTVLSCTIQTGTESTDDP